MYVHTLVSSSNLRKNHAPKLTVTGLNETHDTSQNYQKFHNSWRVRKLDIQQDFSDRHFLISQHITSTKLYKISRDWHDQTRDERQTEAREAASGQYVLVHWESTSH